MNIPSTQRKGFIHGLPCRRTISYDKLLSFLGTVKASTRLFNSFSHCPLTQSSTFDALMVGHESHHHVCLVPSPSSCSNHSQLEQPVPNLAQLSWVLIVSQHLCTPGLVHDHCQGDFFFLSIYGDFPFSNVLALSLPPWEEHSQHPPLGQLQTAGRSLLHLLFSRLNRPTSLNLSSHIPFSSPYHFGGLCWTHRTCAGSPRLGWALQVGSHQCKTEQGSLPSPCWLHTC